MTVRSGWLTNPGQTRADTRLSPVGTYTPVDAMQTRAGVIPGGTGLALSGSGMTATISTGRCIVQGTSAQGAFPVVVTAAEPVVLDNGHASLVRTDLIVARVYDNIVDGSGQTLATVMKINGTPGAGAPATPAACIALYQVAVPANASVGSPPNWGTIVTDVRPYTVAVGGINPGAVAGSYAGQFRDGGGTTGSLERYNGTTWESRVYLSTTGQVVIGGDVNVYRGGANQLKTDDAFVATSVSTTSMASVQVSDATTRIVNSATFVDGPAVLSTTIVVPPSGRVDISGMVTQYNPLAQYCYSDLNVTGATSGAVRTSSDVGALKMVNFNSAGANEISQCLRFFAVATAGDTLTIKWQHHTTGSSAGQFGSRTIVAVPMVG